MAHDNIRPPHRDPSASWGRVAMIACLVFLRSSESAPVALEVSPRGEFEGWSKIRDEFTIPKGK